ncbi:MAPEG family protein [Pseudomonas putida]|uniref:MAPEG family protein n=1 Tax=Pseudomonas putida TaxID=303 RepID=UPI0002D441A4|nr:MAPEG family protein [Pseudomonas putida]
MGLRICALAILVLFSLYTGWTMLIAEQSLALGGLAVALEAATLSVLWLSVVFTVARVLHTLAYLRGLQPWRTLFYGIGVICLLGFCLLITARIGS